MATATPMAYTKFCVSEHTSLVREPLCPISSIDKIKTAEEKDIYDKPFISI